MDKIITVPFGWLLAQLYNLTDSYGLSIIIFGVLVQLVLLPLTMKSKKSTMKMSRLQPKVQAIKKKYPDDQQKQNEALQALYKEEGTGMGCGGCLWSLLPLLILFPLYTVIRQPMTYILGLSNDTILQIAQVFDSKIVDVAKVDQIALANWMSNNSHLLNGIKDLNDTAQAGINFSFLGGINLGANPNANIFDPNFWAGGWPVIGLFLIPVISAGSQVVQMLITQKMNNSVIKNEQGLADEEAAKESQANQTTKVMMWMMPAMSLMIGFGFPGALSLYWFVGGAVRTIEDVILTQHYRKIYDAEDAERLKRTLELEAIEAEKERQRAERRAANPEGITENTSKKKLQQKQRQAEQEAKAAAAKEYAAKKGIEVEENEKLPLSGIKDRPYCKGRAYDPDRYRKTEEEK